MKLPAWLVAAPLLLCLMLEGCGSDKMAKVDDGSGRDGVIKRDIDQSHAVADRQSDFQKEGEQVLSH